LARLEGQVAILKLLQRFPRMQSTQLRAEWVPNAVLRGLKAPPVAL
jgi:cytochrome P450